MSRIDDGRAFNPFRMQVASDDLLIAEASEVAHGYRHLTITHGDPATVAESRALDGFYDTLRVLAAELSWVRVRGDAEFVTITTRGPRAVEELAVFEAAAGLADPGWWSIGWSAVPIRP